MHLLITGANRGLGFEMTAEALERGHSVTAGVRDTGRPNAKLSALMDIHGGRIDVSELDVTNEQSIAELASRFMQARRRIDAIINNAAILTARNTKIEDLNMDDVVQTFDVNVFGSIRVVKHFLPLLNENQGSVINISSEAGSITNAYPGDYPYAISKTALNMFSQQLHSYLEKRGIQVLSVHPGWIKTDMGGAQAPIDPRLSARGIMDLIEHRMVSDTHFKFVDYTGKEMSI